MLSSVSFWVVGNLKKAAECAATYLLYHPEDEVMLGNIKHYKEMEGLSEEDFVPRQVNLGLRDPSSERRG
jgi:hypothetical protein